MRRLAAETPARRVPSASECRFCGITSAGRPDRMDGEAHEEGITEDFWSAGRGETDHGGQRYTMENIKEPKEGPGSRGRANKELGEIRDIAEVPSTRG